MAVDPSFLDRIDSPAFCESLFAVLPDVLFCMKDREGIYRAANRAFAERLGLRDGAELLSQRAEDFFAPDLAATYRAQDQKVLSSGKPLIDELELVTKQRGGTGWHLATKVPLKDSSGAIIGLASVSRDLRTPEAGEAEIAGIARVAEYIRSHLDEELRSPTLAQIAGLSTTQLDRRMRKVYHLSTAQFVRKSRIAHAVDLLRTTNRPIVDIALDCGYGDQTSLSRQFRATVGMPPAAFREHALTSMHR
jgi:PAS domain S-box-containing protein